MLGQSFAFLTSKTGLSFQVGFHLDHHLFLHSQLGGLSHCAEDGGAHRVRGRSGWPNGHRIRHHARRVHHDLLPGEISKDKMEGNSTHKSMACRQVYWPCRLRSSLLWDLSVCCLNINAFRYLALSRGPSQTNSNSLMRRRDVSQPAPQRSQTVSHIQLSHQHVKLSAYQPPSPWLTQSVSPPESSSDWLSGHQTKVEEQTNDSNISCFLVRIPATRRTSACGTSCTPSSPACSWRALRRASPECSTPIMPTCWRAQWTSTTASVTATSPRSEACWTPRAMALACL